VPLSVGLDGAVRSIKLLALSVVGGGSGRAVGVCVVCWMVGGALMVPGLGVHGRVER
jgi:hypothetical protein